MISLAMTLGIPCLSAAQSPVMHYTAAGAPDFSHYIVGQTTVAQISADLGTPVSSRTDANGQPTAMDFLLPLQGETATTTGGIASTAKGIGLAKLESHAGSLLSHIPGLGGMAAAAAVDAGTSKVAGKIIGVGSQDWLCTVLLDHGHYSSASCGLINRPIGG
jgi:hypothetical protein